MKRVGYLAALGGSAGPVAAPSLKPPRRLFPREPVLGDAPLHAEPPAVSPQMREFSTAPVQPAKSATPPAASEPAPAVRGEQTHFDARSVPAPAATLSYANEPPVAGGHPQAEALEPVRPARPVEVVEPRDSARVSPRSPRPLGTPADEPVLEPRRATALPSARRSEAAASARDPGHVPAHAVAERSSAAVTLEPPRARARPEQRQPHTPVPRLPARTASAVPQVHIGTIEVTVVPPAPAPPPGQERKTVAARPGSAGGLRGGRAERWFGLAQR
jgi:hypothetical protein